MNMSKSRDIQAKMPSPKVICNAKKATARITEFFCCGFFFLQNSFSMQGREPYRILLFLCCFTFLFSFIISVYNHLLSSPHRTPAGADVRKNPERNLSYRKYLLRSYVLSRFPSDCWVLRPATTKSPVPDKHPVPFENHPFASYFFSCFL